MNAHRFRKIASQFRKLRIAVIGDFCLDRYWEIDSSKKEISIETGLTVHNIVNVRCQPGGAGTILNNLVALGIGEIYPVGFAGDDGEGFELRRALAKQQGVKMDLFISTNERHTFTYTKPLVIESNKPPRELNRIDLKNSTPVPARLQKQIVTHIQDLLQRVDAMILMDQVDIAETGVITKKVLQGVEKIQRHHPKFPILADSRRGLKNFPPLIFKMNSTELAKFSGRKKLQIEAAGRMALKLAQKNGRPVFVTLSEHGILGASPKGEIEHVPSLPLRGEIDIVGAGDAVTANLIAAMAARATLRESLEIANTAASVVIHQLGTTGTASVKEIATLLG